MEDRIKRMTMYYDISRAMAMSIVEIEARKILSEHPELDEFMMAMGSYFFTYKDNEDHLGPISQTMNSSFHYVYGDNKPFLKPLNDFIGEWDDVFGITGEAMRFTANGETITDW